jgi:hypothetical protein
MSTHSDSRHMASMATVCLMNDTMGRRKQAPATTVRLDPALRNDSTPSQPRRTGRSSEP